MATKKRTLLEYAILGLLHKEPKSGYGLRKLFISTPIGHYSGSPGAIYPALHRLRQAKLITGHVIKSSSLRLKEVFSLTPVGIQQMKLWVGAPVTKEDVIRDMDGLMLRFAFMDGLISREKVLNFLKTFKRETEKYLSELKTIAKSMRGIASKHGLLALESGIELYQGKVRWAKKAIQQINRVK